VEFSESSTLLKFAPSLKARDGGVYDAEREKMLPPPLRHKVTQCGIKD
jgi:hypothetical protein